MRTAICYYSGSGNTELACGYIARRLGIPTDLIDVITEHDVDLTPYELVGLAASTDFWSMPMLFRDFLQNLPDQAGKRAFVFNTYGLRSGTTLIDLASRAAGSGFGVVGGHSMRMAESYPPMIALHLGFVDRPNAKDIAGLDAFIGDLRVVIDKIENGGLVTPKPVKVGWMNSHGRTPSRTKARDDMGEKSVDAELCTRCGTCVKSCPYGAIELQSLPVFDMSRCGGCWRCYNRCPQHAIYTRRFRGGPYYAGPAEQARRALEG